MPSVRGSRRWAARCVGDQLRRGDDVVVEEEADGALGRLDRRRSGAAACHPARAAAAAAGRARRGPRPSPRCRRWSRRRRRSPRSWPGRRSARASESRQRRSSCARLWLAMTTLSSRRVSRGIGACLLVDALQPRRPGRRAVVALGELAGAAAERAALAGVAEQPAIAAAIPGGVVGDAEGQLWLEAGEAFGAEAGGRPPPSARAIASSTFIRMPPPLRTGAATTAASSRCGSMLGASAITSTPARPGREPPAAARCRPAAAAPPAGARAPPA